MILLQIAALIPENLEEESNLKIRCNSHDSINTIA